MSERPDLSRKYRPQAVTHQNDASVRLDPGQVIKGFDDLQRNLIWIGQRESVYGQRWRVYIAARVFLSRHFRQLLQALGRALIGMQQHNEHVGGRQSKKTAFVSQSDAPVRP